MDYKNKRVVITGGSSGIGLALARELASRGAQITIIARHPDRLEQALTEIRKANPGNHTFIPLDVTNSQAVHAAAQQFSQQYPTPDLLVNAAGVAHPGYVQELDLKIYHWMMDVNYFGTVYTTKAFLPGMLERGSGTIVNIGSLVSVLGIIGYTAYGASKFALRGFSDALRMEMKPYGIHVAIVFPPDTDTPQLAYENRYKPAELKKILNIVKMEPIPPDAAAHAILKGLERGKYVIFPDAGTNFLYRAISILNNGVYPILDWLLAKARRDMLKEKEPSPHKNMH